MRPEAAVQGCGTFEIVAEWLVEVELADVEEAILQAEVDVGRNRLADAGQNLPGHRAIVIAGSPVDTQRGPQRTASNVNVIVNIGPARARSDESAPAVFITEVEQDVGHGRPDTDATIAVERLGRIRIRHASGEFDQILMHLDLVG